MDTHRLIVTSIVAKGKLWKADSSSMTNLLVIPGHHVVDAAVHLGVLSLDVMPYHWQILANQTTRKKKSWWTIGETWRNRMQTRIVTDPTRCHKGFASWNLSTRAISFWHTWPAYSLRIATASAKRSLYNNQIHSPPTSRPLLPCAQSMLETKELKRAAVIIQPKPVMMPNAAFREITQAKKNIAK